MFPIRIWVQFDVEIDSSSSWLENIDRQAQYIWRFRIKIINSYVFSQIYLLRSRESCSWGSYRSISRLNLSYFHFLHLKQHEAHLFKINKYPKQPETVSLASKGMDFQRGRIQGSERWIEEGGIVSYRIKLIIDKFWMGKNIKRTISFSVMLAIKTKIWNTTFLALENRASL